MQIFNIHFLTPEYFYLFLIVPFLIYYYIKNISEKSIKINLGENIKKSFGEYNLFFYFKIFLIFSILSIFVLLLADPNKANIDKIIKKNGIDIVIALDISTSMEATDFKPSRLEKAKDVAKKFIKAQKTNRVGMIIFAGKPISSIPLTFDYDIILELLPKISTNTIDQSVRMTGFGLESYGGTAIGDALLMSKNLFKSSHHMNSLPSEKSEYKDLREKVIILLTDGDADRGVEPVLASKLLAEKKIRVYSVGIGGKNRIPIPDRGFVVGPLKTAKLKEVSKNTGGYFFRATDENSLEKIFKKLEELEKNDIEIKVKKSFSEYYNIFIYTLIILIGILFLSEIRRIKNN